MYVCNLFDLNWKNIYLCTYVHVGGLSHEASENKECLDSISDYGVDFSIEK